MREEDGAVAETNDTLCPLDLPCDGEEEEEGEVESQPTEPEESEDAPEQHPPPSPLPHLITDLTNILLLTLLHLL